MPALFNQFQKSDGQSQIFITYFFMVNVFVWLTDALWAVFKSCTNPDPETKIDVWGWIDLFNLVLLAIQLGERIVWELTFPEINRFVEYAGGDHYFDFEQLSWWFEVERILAYVNTLTVFLKYMKLMRLSPRLSLLVKVVYAAGQYVASWFFVAFSLLVGYICMGYILFGAQLESFSTIARTTVTLFNYIVGQFGNASAEQDIWEGSGFDSLKYAGLNQDTVLFFASPTFFFLTFNLIFYLFLMRVMVAIFVTAYTEVSREIERAEQKARELKKVRTDSLKHLPTKHRLSSCGWFLNSYVYSGAIACMPEPPSEKHVLQALKAEPELLKKGYLNYNELETIVREALSSNPTKFFGYVCGKRISRQQVDNEVVEAMCVRLLCIQQVNLHRVPQIMAMFQDMAEKNHGGAGGGGRGGGRGRGVQSSNIEMKMMGESKSGRSYNDKDIGEDGLEEKKGGRGGGLSGRSDAQTEMEWYGDYFLFRLALGWLKLLFVFCFLVVF